MKTNFTLSSYIDRLAHVLALLTIVSLPFSTTLTQASALLSILLAIPLRTYQKKLIACFKERTVLVVVSFYGLFVLGSFYSVAPISDIFLILKKMSKLLLFPLLMPFFVDARWRSWAILGLLGTIMWMILMGMFQEGGTVFKDTILTSVLMAFGGFILLHYYFKQDQPLQKFLCMLGLGMVCLYSAFYSAGRTGFSIFLLLCLLASFQTGGVRRLCKMFAALVCLLCIAYFFVPKGQMTRIARAWHEYKTYDQEKVTRASLQASSIGTRLDFWNNGVQLFLKQPIFGSGTGSFKTVYADQVKSKGLKTTHNPHNQYLHVLVQLGIIGFLGLLWMFLVLWRETRRLAYFERYLVQGVLCTIIVGSLANSWLLDFLPGYLFVLVLAICCSARYMGRQES